ncbi:hypothetical protein AX14_001904 [Amanita brunnescens Koide BX004]|nr:hypothetical protein AX14_001904 [Amanita brunnescens Koide BX004]
MGSANLERGSGTTLQSLKEGMSVRASTVFPVLIPHVDGDSNDCLQRSHFGFAGFSEESNDEELSSAVDEALATPTN